MGGNTSASNTNEVITTSQGTATIPSTTSTAVIPQNTNASTISSNTHNEHTIVSMANQNPPFTPRPLIGMSRTFPPGFTIPTSDPIYGMPTSFMTGFQNNTSTYTRPVTSTLSPLQGSGSGINHMARNNSQQSKYLLSP